MSTVRKQPPASVVTTISKQRPGFQPGQSGNPAGRKKGARHAALVALDAIGQENAQAIVGEVVKQALDGDMTAARILLDRCWPAPKGRLIPLNLPPIRNMASVAQAGAAVLKALSEAIITVDEAASLMSILNQQRQIIETEVLERRLQALEERSN
jgi:hypothetical protein